MIVQPMRITPAKAQEILSKMEFNRPPRKKHVTRLSKAMREGKFRQNNDLMCFDPKTFNGQHRLRAIVESGVTQEVLVISGLPEDSFAFIDTGVKRSAADALYIDGETNCTHLAAALVLVDRYYNKDIASRNVRYDNEEVISLLDKYPAVRDSLASLSYKKYPLLPRSSMAALHTIFKHAYLSREAPSGVTPDEFIAAIHTGDFTATTQQAKLLRERLISNAAATRKLPLEHLLALTVKTWNHCRAGTETKNLLYRDNESFPEAR